MGGIGGGKQKSSLQTKQFPGLFGDLGQTGAEIGQQTRGVLSGGLPASPFRSSLESSILQPNFAPNTASETALLDQLSSMTQGTSALRGLGPATPGGLAQNLAPALIGLRQQQIGNLQGAYGQDMTTGLQQRGQTLQGLLELAGLSMPQIVGGQKSSGKNAGLSIGRKEN